MKMPSEKLLTTFGKMPDAQPTVPSTIGMPLLNSCLWLAKIAATAKTTAATAPKPAH